MRVKVFYVKEQEEGDEVTQAGGSGQRHSGPPDGDLDVLNCGEWLKLHGQGGSVRPEGSGARRRPDRRGDKRHGGGHSRQPSSYGEHWFKKKAAASQLSVRRLKGKGEMHYYKDLTLKKKHICLFGCASFGIWDPSVAVTGV